MTEFKPNRAFNLIPAVAAARKSQSAAYRKMRREGNGELARVLYRGISRARAARAAEIFNKGTQPDTGIGLGALLGDTAND